MKKLILAVSLLAAVSTAQASEACRSLSFKSGAEQYHGEKITTGKDALPVDSIICDKGNGVATWSYDLAGQHTEENLIKTGDNVYMLFASPANSASYTTVIAFHFAKDGSVNYLKSYNGLSSNMNKASFAIGEWYF